MVGLGFPHTAKLALPQGKPWYLPLLGFSKSGPVFSELRNSGWNQTVANISFVPKISSPLGPKFMCSHNLKGNQKWEILQGRGWGTGRLQESENRCGKHGKWKQEMEWKDVDVFTVRCVCTCLVCLDCSNKRTTVWVAETAGMSCLTDLEARTARPRCTQGEFLPRAAWRICSSFLCSFLVACCPSLVSLNWTSPQFLPSPSCGLLPVCMSVSKFPLYMDISHIRLGHPNDPILT